MSLPIEVFISYSPQDETDCQQLDTHLALMKRQGVISTWHRGRLVAGTEWDEAIREQLARSRAILLLVSAEFIASDYCWGVEMERSLARHESRDAVVIPIVVRACDWQSAPFAKLKELPEGGQAIASRADRDEAWVNVVQGIRTAIANLPVPPELELRLEFAREQQVQAIWGEKKSPVQGFEMPLNSDELEEMRWYLETYGAQYTAEIDDGRAGRVAERLPVWGDRLLAAVCTSDRAREMFAEFCAQAKEGRQVTVCSESPKILGLPWELLRDRSEYLWSLTPRVAVRRRLFVAESGDRSGFGPLAAVEPKDVLRLLFVVSRPEGASFLNPRLEPIAVLEAIAAEAPGRVEVEFLRPATLEALAERLEREPRVDIVHFDGHGCYAPGEELEREPQQSEPVAALKRGTGYLLFEKGDREMDLRSAEELGNVLARQRVRLVVLSACESARVKEGDDPLASVAARLSLGIPAVVAMTHSVLAVTARSLFGEFYKGLARGQGIGSALEGARRLLYIRPERGDRWRGEDKITLKLQDWFLPALYQDGADAPLLKRDGTVARSPVGESCGNVQRLPRAGFFGRARELWAIERALTVEGKRRVTISGFGGQGKTALALEAGRWLCRIGEFETACFVDYADFQGVDAVDYAVSELGVVLEEGLVDAAAARRALASRRVMLILDNLEALGAEALRGLLAAAREWSQVGGTRVLLTTRQGALEHPGYELEETREHLWLGLSGLHPEDAVTLYEALVKLRPAAVAQLPGRSDLRRLFELVSFHPQSLEVLTPELKRHGIGAVGPDLARWVREHPGSPLVASLNLSIERLDPEVRRWLPRLGVFAGGANETTLLAVTELEEQQWQQLRAQLEATGLVLAEELAGVSVPFVRFHPTLAPVLWSELATAEREALQGRHRQRYYDLSRYLYVEDVRNPLPARAIARRELPNLLRAVREALEAGEDYAVDFVAAVSRFLYFFGLNRDRASLSRQAQAAAGEVGSQSWVLSRSALGEQLLAEGRLQEAEQIFADVLAALGETPSYNRSLTLGRLGRCLEGQGRAAEAIARYREGIAVAEQLEPTNLVKRHIGVLRADLGDMLRQTGAYEEARQAYEASLAIDRELSDDRGEAVVQGQLGGLELMQGNLPEAERRYREALTTFQRLNEPATEAVVWHQLGRVYEEARQWEAAERAYRESARIEEAQGNLAGAAQTWNQIAVVNQLAGRPEAAEAWYRKAIAGSRTAGDRSSESVSLNNLANLLRTQSDRLSEARQLAEAALAIDLTLDPAAAQIWTTYSILANISEASGNPSEAREYRRLMRQAKAAFAGTQYELQRFAPLIDAVVAAVADANLRPELEAALDGWRERGWVQLVGALRSLLAGSRDEDDLCASLDYEDSMVVMEVLRRLE